MERGTLGTFYQNICRLKFAKFHIFWKKYKFYEHPKWPKITNFGFQGLGKAIPQLPGKVEPPNRGFGPRTWIFAKIFIFVKIQKISKKCQNLQKGTNLFFDQQIPKGRVWGFRSWRMQFSNPYSGPNARNAFSGRVGKLVFSEPNLRFKNG